VAGPVRAKMRAAIKRNAAPAASPSNSDAQAAEDQVTQPIADNVSVCLRPERRSSPAAHFHIGKGTTHNVRTRTFGRDSSPKPCRYRAHRTNTRAAGAGETLLSPEYDKVHINDGSFRDATCADSNRLSLSARHTTSP